MLGKEDTAVKGNFLSALAMFIAVSVTVVDIVNPIGINRRYSLRSYYWINNSFKSKNDFNTRNGCFV
jgi:hypothetical protein